MVNHRKQHTRRKPAKQGVRDVIPEPNKIGFLSQKCNGSGSPLNASGCGLTRIEKHPASVYLRSFLTKDYERTERGAHRNFYQKTVASESPHRD